MSTYSRRSILPEVAPRFVPRLSQRRSFFGQLQTEAADDEGSRPGMRTSIIAGIHSTSRVLGSVYGSLATFANRRKTAPDVSWVRPESLAASPGSTTGMPAPAEILAGTGSLSRARQMSSPAFLPSKRHDDHPEEQQPVPGADRTKSRAAGTRTSAATSKWEIVRSLVTAPMVPEADAAVRDVGGGGGDMPKILLNWKARTASMRPCWRAVRVVFISQILTTCSPGGSVEGQHCCVVAAASRMAAEQNLLSLLTLPPHSAHRRASELAT